MWIQLMLYFFLIFLAAGELERFEGIAGRQILNKYETVPFLIDSNVILYLL